MESSSTYQRRTLSPQVQEMVGKYLPWASIGILVVMYGVGLVGLHTSQHDWFLAATPLTLVLSCGLMLLNHRVWNAGFAALMALIAVAGYLIEVLGVKTGMVFGEYAYGQVLGPMLWDTPLVIGLNWLLLVYATGNLAVRLNLPKVLQAGIAALGMTLLDVMIEPVAMRLGFWSWGWGTVPLQNYLAWFLAGFLLLLAFVNLRNHRPNPLALAVLVLQVVFFGILNLNI